VLDKANGIPRMIHRSGPWLIVAAALGMVGWTWQTWPDVLVDFGRELYLPWQIAQGKALYVDIASFNGPLSPYVNVLWFRLLGLSIRSLTLANFALVCALLWLLYKVFLAIADRVSATLACLTFIAIFGFGQLSDAGNYNFIAPYAHELTHGVILSVAALYAFIRYVRSGLLMAAATAGVLIGLVFLTKPEVFVAGAPAIGIGLALAPRVVPRLQQRSVAAVLGCAMLGFLVVWAVAFALLSLTMPPGRAFTAIVAWPPVINPRVLSLPFYRRMSGFDHPLGSLRTMLLSAAAYLLVLGGAAIGAFAVRRIRYGAEVTAIIGFITLGIIVFSGALELRQMARPLPLFMAGLIFLQARSLWNGEQSEESLLRLAMSLFSFLLLGKIVLNVTVSQYGFALAMPATLLFVVALVSWAPQWISRFGGTGGFFKAAALTLWVIVVGLHLSVIGRRLAEHRITVG
jgi:hypothetical protein